MTRGEGVGAALGGDGPGHEVAASGLHGGAGGTTTIETASDTASIIENRFMGSPSREVWVAAQYPGARGTVKPEPTRRPADHRTGAHGA